MKLASIFRDNMVFQAEKPLRFFGKGEGLVEITLNGKKYSQSFLGDTWEMELPSQAYGGPFDIDLRLQGEAVTLKNVAFGDVFLCAGQSNIEFCLINEKGASPIRTDNKIRFFYSDRKEKEDEVKTTDGWLVCEEGKIDYWSALGAHIAQEYRKNKDVFVGLVGCYQGASAIRSWMPERTLTKDVYVPLEERHNDNVDPLYCAWNGDSYLYQSTFLPLAPFGFKAVIWYQGESNTAPTEAKFYTKLLSNFINAWREDLKDGELPFVVVEICDFDGRNDEAWRTVQRCQQEAAKIVKNVTAVTSKDVCEHSNIHPANKEKLAKKIVAVL